MVSRSFVSIPVRLLTHVLCKPKHFFLQLFIATISNYLQTSFNSVMNDWPDKYHVWGTPARSSQGQTRDHLNTRFQYSREQLYMCYYRRSVEYICMPYIWLSNARQSWPKITLKLSAALIPFRVYRLAPLYVNKL